MKKSIGLVLSAIVILVLSGCTPREKKVITKSDNYVEVKVSDRGCGRKLKEASDLAYDQERNILYIVGDKGDFYTCSVKNRNNRIELKFLSASKIQHNFKSIDSEGLDINDEGELILSTEGTNAGIFNFTKEGLVNGDLGLPYSLENAEYFDSNSKFEALTYHPEYGILTAAERPINQKDVRDQTIYNFDGHEWNFKAENYDKSSVVALQTMDDGNVLVLERALRGKKTLYITVKKLFISDADQTDKECNTEIIYKARWDGGNFEGLTKIPTDNGNIYLMVNDGQGRFKTIFKAFKIKE